MRSATETFPQVVRIQIQAGIWLAPWNNNHRLFSRLKACCRELVLGLEKRVAQMAVKNIFYCASE